MCVYVCIVAATCLAEACKRVYVPQALAAQEIDCTHATHPKTHITHLKDRCPPRKGNQRPRLHQTAVWFIAVQCCVRIATWRV